MDFSAKVVSVFASLFIVLRRFFLLIVSPYKTMRNISKETDKTQLVILSILIFVYFVISSDIKETGFPSYVLFLFALINYFITVFFFYAFSVVMRKRFSVTSFLFTFAYALLPTLIWFISNSILFVILPPPRTISVLGKAFSIFFLSFSISLLCWKVILFYLSIRFSTHLHFFTIIFSILLFLCLVLPYSYLLYYYHIFRIPFL